LENYSEMVENISRFFKGNQTEVLDRINDSERV